MLITVKITMRRREKSLIGKPSKAVESKPPSIKT